MHAARNSWHVVSTLLNVVVVHYGYGSWQLAIEIHLDDTRAHADRDLLPTTY